MRTSLGSIWPGVPLLVWLALLLTVLFGWMARSTRIGRNLYALGSSPESARLVGINETWHIAFVFILSGLLCGLVGVLWGARFGTVDAVLAPDLHLQAISAVVIGGVSIFGGSGSVYGAAIGAVIFAVLQNGVQLLGVNQFWLEAVIGAAILGTVMFYSMLARGAERAEQASRRPSLARPADAATEPMTRLRGLVARWEVFLLLFLIGTCVCGSRSSQYFLTASNISIAIAGAVPTAIVALGMTLIIVTGEIDVSVGSIVGLCAATLAVAIEQGAADRGGDGCRGRHRHARRSRSTASSSPTPVCRRWS